MKKVKGFTLIELLIVVLIIAILAAIAVPNFLEAQVRSKVSRVKADQRSYATAIEAYYVDNNLYPSMGLGNAGANGGVTVPGTATPNEGIWKVYTFRVWATAAEVNKFHTLTTPISYIGTYFPDAFAKGHKAATFAYYQDTNGWIIASYGPDVDDTGNNPGDLGIYDGGGIDTVYRSNIAQPSLTLTCGHGTAGAGEAFTYDPTNGTISPGDVYRVKQ
jgi:prepilin-type N-terminal cleavage/methylation domain-containing protein